MKKMFRVIPDMVKALAVTAALLWLLTGCSCERRVERLKERCPGCFTVQTVTLTDTLVPDPVHILQHIPWSTLDWHDTLRLEQPQYTLLIISDDEGLTFDAEVRPDTVIVTRDVPVKVPVEVHKPDPWPWAAAVVVAMVSIWGIVHSVTRRKKK